jgi:hypothetical protein
MGIAVTRKGGGQKAVVAETLSRYARALSVRMRIIFD